MSSDVGVLVGSGGFVGARVALGIGDAVGTGVNVAIGIEVERGWGVGDGGFAGVEAVLQAVIRTNKRETTKTRGGKMVFI